MEIAHPSARMGLDSHVREVLQAEMLRIIRLEMGRRQASFLLQGIDDEASVAVFRFGGGGEVEGLQVEHGGPLLGLGGLLSRKRSGPRWPLRMTSDPSKFRGRHFGHDVA